MSKLFMEVSISKGDHMQVAVRSSLMAGVAVIGVGVLAASPVVPTLPVDEALTAHSHSSVAVELAALVNPLEEYAKVFNVALQNIASLGERIAEDPAPILGQIIANQLNSAAGIATFVGTFGQTIVTQLGLIPGQLQIALQELGEGNVTAALNTVLNAALGPIVQAVVDTLLFNPAIYEGLQHALVQPFQNLVNVINLTSYPNVLNLLGPLLAPVQIITDVTNAVGAAGDGIVAGLRTGNLEEIANALLSLGPDLAGAVLNGTSAQFGAGLLGPSGIFAGLLTIRDLIADAITPQETLATATVSDVALDAPTVTLKVTPAADSSGNAETPVAEPVSADSDGASTEAPAGETGEEAPAETPAATEEVPPVTDDDADDDAGDDAAGEGLEAEPTPADEDADTGGTPAVPDPGDTSEDGCEGGSENDAAAEDHAADSSNDESDNSTENTSDTANSDSNDGPSGNGTE
jgi:hypothetical protein